MKNIARITLLSLWLFAICAPSVITVLNEDQNLIVNINLNEEEQQEQGKSIDQQLVIKISEADFSLLSRYYTALNFGYRLMKNSNSPQEIFLPPPELI